MRFWLVVCACTVGGVWYTVSNDAANESASIIEAMNPSCTNIRAWENARISGGEPTGLPAPDEERLIECFPTYENKEHLIRDHFRYARYLQRRMMDDEI